MSTFMQNPAFQLVAVLLFWMTSSATEGWKWRQNDGKPDNSTVITWNSYHIWRSFNTLAFLSAPFVYCGLVSFLLANAIGWLIYERFMSLVEYDDLWYKRPTFHVVNNLWIKRPSPTVEMEVIGAMGLIYMALSVT